MPRLSIPLPVRLSALNVANFLGIGIYMTFFPVWLQSRGMDAATIGIVLAIPIVVRILATPPLMALADRRIPLRSLLLASQTTQLVGYPTLLLMDSPAAIAAMVGLLAMAQASVGPGNELVTANAIRLGQARHYGRIRVWGSIAFLGTSIAAGYLIGAHGPRVIVWGLAAAPAVGIAATLIALGPNSPLGAGRTQEAAKDPKAAFPPLLWAAIAAAAAIQASHAALYAFGSIHWQSQGFSEAAIGYLWAVGVLAEITVFTILGGRVGRGSAGFGLLVIGAGTAILRFAVLSLDPGLAATFALQAMHGLSFGATHLGGMAALAALTPAGSRGRSQGLYASAQSFAMAAATVASGPIYRAFGPLVFTALIPLSVFGLALALWGLRRVGDVAAQPQSAGEGG